MRMLARLAVLTGLAAIAGMAAMAQTPTPFPQTLPANTVVGRLGVTPGPAQAIPFATLSGRVGSLFRSQQPSGVFLTNDATATGFKLIPKYGNQIPLYCPLRATWETYTVDSAGLVGNVSSISIDSVAGQSILGNDLQQTIPIVDVANNGSGLIRIQVADTTLLSAAAGVGYYITGATGTGALPNAINSFNAVKIWRVTIIDATHADLIGSAFTTGTYSASTAYIGVGLPYSVYLQYDSLCSAASFDLSALQGYSTSSTVGIPVRAGPTGTASLVGMLVKRGGTIQGGAGSEYLISWYNRAHTNFSGTLTGNTGVTTGSYVKLTGNIEFLLWSDDMPVVKTNCSLTGTKALNTVSVGLTASGTFQATVAAGSTGLAQSFLDIAPGNPFAIVSDYYFNSSNGGFYSINGWLKTNSGTATAGAANNCNLTAFSTF